MSYNGSGTFLINTAGQPVVTGTVISSTTFNTLTADLGTGLSTAITKDGQTTTTSRIPFIAGISSTLTTDSTSVGTGSIISSGGVGIAKALFVGTTANIAGAVTLGGAVAITSSSANALAVGLNGATNPAFNVDASTASSATGLNVKSAAAAGGVALSVTSSGSNEALTLNAKGTGTIGIGSVSTGAVTITPATTVTGLITSTGGITGGASSHTTGAFSSTLGVTGAATLSSTLDVTGISSFAAGTAALPSITRTGDLDTGMWFPAANTLGFSTSGSERARLDSSGGLTLGFAASPYNSAQMEIYRATAGDALMISSPTGTGNQNAIAWSNSRGDVVSARIYNVDDGAYGASIVFANRTGVGTTTTEKMRLDTSGNLLINATSSFSSGKVCIKDDLSVFNLIALKSTVSWVTGTFYLVGVNSSGAIIGGIVQASQTTLSYTTSSDERLKNNIVDAPSALESIENIRIRSFDWKEDGNHQKFGVVAQEVLSIVPEAISVGCTEEEMMGVDYSKFVPRLIKAIQEQQALIQSLTTRLTALEAK